MSERLTGKVAIVTGGADGMGAAHARLFVEEGAKVVLTDIQEEKGQQLAEELGPNALFVKHDVTSEEDWAHVVEESERAFGPVTVLVNNAGMSYSSKSEEMNDAQWQKVVALNESSVFYGIKHVIPSMRKAGQGSIVNISSVSGFVGQAGGLAYNATKFAVRGMTKSAALEYADDHIRVNSIHPGVIRTHMIDEIMARGGEGKRVTEEMVGQIPLKRMAEPKEVSYAVLFLASDEASYITGTELLVDGGTTAV